MSVEEVMEKKGFRLSASCAGKASFTKFLKHEGKRAYITVTDAGGEGFPNTMEEAVLVTLFDARSGDELGEPQNFSSLGAYLETVQE